MAYDPMAYDTAVFNPLKDSVVKASKANKGDAIGFASDMVDENLFTHREFFRFQSHLLNIARDAAATGASADDQDYMVQREADKLLIQLRDMGEQESVMASSTPYGKVAKDNPWMTPEIYEANTKQLANNLFGTQQKGIPGLDNLVDTWIN